MTASLTIDLKTGDYTIEYPDGEVRSIPRNEVRRLTSGNAGREARLLNIGTIIKPAI